MPNNVRYSLNQAIKEPFDKIFIEQNRSGPKAQVFIPMYEPLEVTRCEECGKAVAELKELVRIRTTV